MAAPRIDIESVREVRNATNAGERLHEDDTASSSFIHPISRHDFRQVQYRGNRRIAACMVTLRHMSF
jgi:hypothetical protein